MEQGYLPDAVQLLQLLPGLLGDGADRGGSLVPAGIELVAVLVQLNRHNVVAGYVEIKDGLTEDDMVAFPYGKNVKPGVPTEEGDYSDMYN